MEVNENTGPLDKQAGIPNQAVSTRREFLGQVGQKAVYVAPLVLALRAQHTIAASAGSCLSAGMTCVLPADCCSGMCVNMGGMLECV